MIPQIGKNSIGETLPILTPKTASFFTVDGSIAHAESAALQVGNYRISVRTSTDSLGVMISIYKGTADYATTSHGMFMPHNSTEVFALEEGSIISVIDGIINVTPLM
jgi:hypothetical protein